MGLIKYIKNKKIDLYCSFIRELKYFVNTNANNITLDKRIYSLYYFLSCHPSYDDIIISLNRFIKAKKAYSFKEIMLIRFLKLKLEMPVFWLNRIIKG